MKRPGCGKKDDADGDDDGDDDVPGRRGRQLRQSCCPRKRAALRGGKRATEDERMVTVTVNWRAGGRTCGVPSSARRMRLRRM